MLLEQSDALDGDGHDVGLGRAEDVFALLGRSGIIKVENDALRAPHRLERAGDQLLAALAEELNGDVGRDVVFLDQAAAEIEFDLRGGGESDLDFLKTDLNEQVEKLDFLLHAHGLGEGLVAIAQIDAAPHRGMVEDAPGPLAVGQIDGGKRAVFRDRSGLHKRNKDGRLKR